MKAVVKSEASGSVCDNMTVETMGCGKCLCNSLRESERIETISTKTKGQECDLVSNGQVMSSACMGDTTTTVPFSACNS